MFNTLYFFAKGSEKKFCLPAKWMNPKEKKYFQIAKMSHVEANIRTKLDPVLHKKLDRSNNK